MYSICNGDIDFKDRFSIKEVEERKVVLLKGILNQSYILKYVRLGFINEECFVKGRYLSVCI